MKKAIILALAAALMCTSVACAASVEECIAEIYPHAVKMIGNEFPGPVSEELAQVALLRQRLEDGADRSPHYSINGMVVGGRNTEIIKSLGLPPNIVLSTVVDPDGQTLYCLQGTNACLFSILAIAKWLDKHIKELTAVSSKDKTVWERSKTMSYLLTTPFADERHKVQIDNDAPVRNELLDRVNGWYGPRGDTLTRQRKSLQPLFTGSMK